MRERTVIFDGVDLCERFGMKYSRFVEDIPQPKTTKVAIPGGADVDITEAVGPVAFSNGTHTFEFLLYGDTQVERLAKKRALFALVVGKYKSYRLSWDPGYVYTGRWSAEVEHFSDNADFVTLIVDRYPWKIGDPPESIDMNSHLVAEYLMEGSERYANVAIVTRQNATVQVGDESAEYSAGSYDLAAQIYGDTLVTVTVGDWWQYLDGTNLVVNPAKITISSEDAAFNSDWVQNGTDLYCENEAKQHSTLTFIRKDL